MECFWDRLAAVALNQDTFRVVDVQDKVQVGGVAMDLETCHLVAVVHSPVVAFLDDGERVAVEHCAMASNEVVLALALALP